MNFAEKNNMAKFLFDKRLYEDAIHVLEQDGGCPLELYPYLAQCYYYNNNARKAIEILNSYKDYKKDEFKSPLLIAEQIDLALYYNAIGDFDKAVEIYESIPYSNIPKAEFNLGWHIIREGKFKEGFIGLERGRELNCYGNSKLNTMVDPSKLWDGKSNVGTLAYVLEGGLGDEIIFLRFVNNNYIKSKCKQIIVFCHSSLIRLFTNAGYYCLPIQSLPFANFDYYIPAMSIPAVIDSIVSPKVNDSYTYIESYTDKYITNCIRSVAGDKPAIAVKWMGNPEFEHDQFRTVPKNDLLSIVSKYGQPFSLQFEDRDINIPNLIDLIRDWQDTYSVLASVDLIVTSCTSVAHLAGAMGKKVIVLVPLVSYFTWACDDIHWYGDNVIVIRQDKYNDWKGAFDILDHYMSL